MHMQHLIHVHCNLAYTLHILYTARLVRNKRNQHDGRTNDVHHNSGQNTVKKLRSLQFIAINIVQILHTASLAGQH